MQEQIFRPAIKEILAVYAAVYVITLLVVFGFLSLMGVPPFIFYPVGVLVLVVGTVFFVLQVSKAFWTGITERYAVGDGYVRIQRGWASRTSGLVPFRNVAEARAVMPLLLRIFGIGFVLLDTNDGTRHVLYDVKGPDRIVEEIRLAQAGAPVPKPSTG